MIDSTQELGLNISDKAIEQMKANLVLDEEQMKMAAVEEKKRRRRFQNIHRLWAGRGLNKG